MKNKVISSSWLVSRTRSQVVPARDALDIGYNKSMKKIDLTHTLSPNIPHWDGDCCFKANIAVDYKDCTPPNLFRVQKLEMKAGAGTHIDAPAHCFADGKTVDVLELENLVTECMVIHTDVIAEDYLITAEVLEKFEKENGKIPENSFVIFHTGWDQYWDDAEKYRNNLKFPSLHEDVAKFLLERNVVGVGIDTLSPDAVGKDFPVHRLLLGAGKFIVENIANAKLLPPTGAKVTILPIKIKDGTEAPVRVIAFV